MGNLDEKFIQLKQEIDDRMQEILSKPNPYTLYEPMRYILRAGGKRLRPILLLLSCEAVGGNPSKCIDAAVAVEMLHNFTLIHDDVMDQDDTRRGQETVHNKWDVNVAILSGDGLVALSYRYLMSCNHPRIAEIGRNFSDALLELCEGQALDKEFENRWDVTVDDYFTMIRKKTAVLIALCTQIGAIFGNGAPEQIENLHEYGLNMGMAFQIQDDLLDIVADEKTLGKDWGSDIVQRKKTFLLIHALEAGSPRDREEIHAVFEKKQITPEDVRRVQAIFERTGTLEAAQQLVRQHVRTAREKLSALPESDGKANLNAFLDVVSHRSF